MHFYTYAYSNTGYCNGEFPYCSQVQTKEIPILYN
jgi:hypothetical protein